MLNKTTPIAVKTRVECLEESIKSPAAALAYFEDEFLLDNFNKTNHPVIGEAHLFIKDILKVWLLNDMGTNIVVNFLNKAIVKPFSYANSPMLNQLFKCKAHSTEATFIRDASSINPNVRQFAEKSLNDENSFLHSKSTKQLNIIAKIINQADGPGTWDVRDMGANPIVTQLRLEAVSISEPEIESDDEPQLNDEIQLII